MQIKRVLRLSDLLPDDPLQAMQRVGVIVGRAERIDVIARRSMARLYGNFVGHGIVADYEAKEMTFATALLTERMHEFAGTRVLLVDGAVPASPPVLFWGWEVYAEPMPVPGDPWNVKYTLLEVQQ